MPAPVLLRRTLGARLDLLKRVMRRAPCDDAALEILPLPVSNGPSNGPSLRSNDLTSRAAGPLKADDGSESLSGTLPP
jgi:hypothetical protein